MQRSFSRIFNAKIQQNQRRGGEARHDHNSVKVPRKTSNPRNSITPCSPYLYEAYKVGTTIPEQEKCDLVRFLLNIRLFEGENIKNNQCQTPCAVWHHSRPHRRLWTIPAVLDIYILRSPRSATQMCCPVRDCDLPQSAAISPAEIASSSLEIAGDRNLDFGRPI